MTRPERPQPEKCPACGEPIYWTIAENGKRIAVNATGASLGTLLLFWRGTELHSKVVPPTHYASSEEYYNSHRHGGT